MWNIQRNCEKIQVINETNEQLVDFSDVVPEIEEWLKQADKNYEGIYEYKKGKWIQIGK